MLEKELQRFAKEIFQKELETCTKEEMYLILFQFTQEKLKSLPQNGGVRKLYYISAEFLIGKLLSNHLINLGYYKEAKNTLEKYGYEIEDIEEFEKEPSLGNGGLGRLAACFLDSIATLGLNGDGIGLNYHFGLFHQMIRNLKQTEEKDQWITTPNWLEQKDKTYTVSFGERKVKAKQYDILVSGFQSCATNILHLFDLEDLDEGLVKEGIIFDKEDIEHNLTLFLYPDDSDRAGNVLRIYQQYFMVSCGAQMIIEECKEDGVDLHKLQEHVVIQINDTHPSMIIPELIRLLEIEGIDFEEAVEIVKKTIAYTNHTILAEALETWPMEYLEEAVPQLVPIIKKLDQLIKSKEEDSSEKDLVNKDLIKKEIAVSAKPENKKKSTHIIDENNKVHMAHMDIHYGFSVNGVAALHSKILMEEELHEFYKLYPEKFQNVTNGITFRRWLLHTNPLLADYLKELIGDGFETNPMELEGLLKYKENAKVLQELLCIKNENKKIWKRHIWDTQGIEIDETSIFDVQAKRLHEYKRQQMNALYIIYKYLEIKKGKKPKRPITFIFGAKAAPAYTIAKDIIHLILTLSRMIEKDEEVRSYLKVVMIENYNVTEAELLIPACDLSEQISLASKEASGTGNMKFMLNGGITIGTMDGANVEIYDLVEKENIYIFGKSSETVMDHYKKADYISGDFYVEDENIKEILDFIVQPPLWEIGDKKSLFRLYKEMLSKDWFMTLLDLKEYITTKETAFSDYENPMEWAEKMLVNIAKAGYFSSDRSIKEYNDKIWKL